MSAADPTVGHSPDGFRVGLTSPADLRNPEDYSLAGVGCDRTSDDHLDRVESWPAHQALDANWCSLPGNSNE